MTEKGLKHFSQIMLEIAASNYKKKFIEKKKHFQIYILFKPSFYHVYHKLFYRFHWNFLVGLKLLETYRPKYINMVPDSAAQGVQLIFNGICILSPDHL